MEKDKWKNFINENKSEFENEFPSENLWDKIESGLKKKQPKMVPLRTVITYAAAAVLVLSVGLIWLMKSNTSQETKLQAKTEKEESYFLASISPEYAEVENYYVSRIDRAMTELKEYTPDEEMMQAVKDLDLEFKRLQKEMSENVNRSEIIEAMIENYRLKLDLLEQILEAMEEDQSQETQELKAV